MPLDSFPITAACPPQEFTGASVEASGFDDMFVMSCLTGSTTFHSGKDEDSIQSISLGIGMARSDSRY